MPILRPKVLLAFNENVRTNYLPPKEIARLEMLADLEWFPCEGGNIYEIPYDLSLIHISEPTRPY